MIAYVVVFFPKHVDSNIDPLGSSLIPEMGTERHF